MLDEFYFRFPPAKYVPTNGVTRSAQADQIVEEAAEVYQTAMKDDEHSYVEKLLDCIYACETALREFDGNTIDKICEEVIAKNKKRGYYEKDMTMGVMLIDNLLPPLNVALAYSHEEAKEHLRRFGIPEHELQPSDDTPGEAICVRSDKSFCAVVRIDDRPDNRETMLGVLVHESTHVAQHYFDSIGERCIGDEIRAYVTQSIGQALLEEYLLKHEQPKIGE